MMMEGSGNGMPMNEMGGGNRGAGNMMVQQQQNVGGADLGSLGNNMGIMGSDSGVGDLRPQDMQRGIGDMSQASLAQMKRNQMQQQQQMMLRQQQQQQQRRQQQQQQE
jgi:hypothetical protein